MKQTAVERIAAKTEHGLAGLATWAGVSRSTACNWNRPADKHNGRGGAIPDRYHERIINNAAADGVRIEPGELVNV